MSWKCEFERMWFDFRPRLKRCNHRPGATPRMDQALARLEPLLLRIWLRYLTWTTLRLHRTKTKTMFNKMHLPPAVIKSRGLTLSAVPSIWARSTMLTALDFTWGLLLCDVVASKIANISNFRKPMMPKQQVNVCNNINQNKNTINNLNKF